MNIGRVAYWTPPVPERFGQAAPTRGFVFTCRRCRRPVAISRDDALKAWGEQGIVAEVAAPTRCRYCRHRGVDITISPGRAKLGSQQAIDELVSTIGRLKPRGKVG